MRKLVMEKTDMKLSCLMALLYLGICICASAADVRKPDAVVRKLYDQVVARRPLGVPKGLNKDAIWPFLSKRLIRRLETAQACEADYYRQHVGDDGKPRFGWLESGLFSGENEMASPVEAVVENMKPQKDGSFHVYVKLRFKDGESPDSALSSPWYVATRVITERGRFVVDDILLFEKDSTEVESRRLSGAFTECDGSHWIGRDAVDK